MILVSTVRIWPSFVLSLPDSRYPELPERTQFVNSVLERLHGLPGVQAVAASGTLPFDPVPETDLELEGHTYEPGNEPSAEILTVSPEYFGTMGIRLLAGRNHLLRRTLRGIRPPW